MIRVAVVVPALCALVLFGCSKSEYASPPQSTPVASTADEVTVTAARAPVDAPAPSPAMRISGGQGAMGKPASEVERERQWMAYSHSMQLVMPPATVEPHFTRARDFCLQNAALNCILIAGSANAGDENAQQPPSAQLTVTLPHDQVAVFEKAVLAPLAGQAKTDIVVRQQSTQAENLTQQVTDIDRRVSQLSSYRDRLTAIAERSNIKASDLIELEEKISELQSELDQLASSKLQIVERVTRERLDISFIAQVSLTDTGRPVSQAWDQSFEVLGQSASTVLLLVVGLLPWIPLALLVWLVVALIRRSMKRRRAAAVVIAPVTPPPAPPAANT